MTLWNYLFLVYFKKVGEVQLENKNKNKKE